jgi:DNA-binding NtrC family response regulator
MNQLVFIVEDDRHIKRLLTIILEKKEIPFIFASSLPDAIALFELNKEVISYIAIDGNLTHDHVSDLPETLDLARIIADSRGFKGKTFAMSCVSKHCTILKETIGEQCEIFSEHSFSIKFDTIKEIARRIVEKRERKEEAH